MLSSSSIIPNGPSTTVAVRKEARGIRHSSIRAGPYFFVHRKHSDGTEAVALMRWQTKAICVARDRTFACSNSFCQHSDGGSSW